MKKIIILVGVVILSAGIIFGFFYLNKSKSLSEYSFSENLKTPGKLIVGIDSSYGVMEFIDENNLPAGIDVDIINEIGRRLNIGIEIKSQNWDTLFTSVKNGDIDLAISSITITADRSKEILFSAPYFNGGQVIVVRKDNSTILSPSDLINKKVGVQTGTTSYEEAKKLNTIITSYETWHEAELPGGGVSDLKENKIDAIVVDYIQAIDWIKNNSDLKIEGEPFTQEYYGIATRLENTTLISEIDRVLRDMKREGVIQNIEKKWVIKK